MSENKLRSLIWNFIQSWEGPFAPTKIDVALAVRDQYGSLAASGTTLADIGRVFDGFVSTAFSPTVR